MQIRGILEINLSGLSRMVRAVLPGARNSYKVSIARFSSVHRLVSFPATSYHQATKFTVGRLSYAFWQDVEPLGKHAFETATRNPEDLHRAFFARETVSRGGDFPKGIQGQAI